MRGGAMTLGEAKRIIGGSLGFPVKMPGTSFGLPASACITGAKLARVPGTVCSDCYALRDRHVWQNPTKAQHRRLEAIKDPRWIDAMALMLRHIHAKPTFRIDMGIKNAKARGIVRTRHNESGYHRWHDSGDLQSIEHLAAICEVARRTPAIRHWLPTNELGLVKRYLASGASVPVNLVIRVSSIMLDDAARRAWPQTSSVFTDQPPGEYASHVCPASTQDHRCGTCRACWSPDVAHVAYPHH